MTTLALVDWDDLSAAEAAALVKASDMEFDVQAYALSSSLSVVDELTSVLRPSGGDVHWLGDATVHRDASFGLLRELSWGTALVRLSVLLGSSSLGLTALRDVGAFCLHTPDTVLGETTLDDRGDWVTRWDVTGQDRLYYLDRQVGRSYVVLAGTSVLDAIRQVYTDAGLTGVLIDSTASDATVLVDMAWPLIPAQDSTDDSSGSDPTTWLRIINDLHTLINYRGAWVDEHGYYRSTPYVDPGSRPSLGTFDATDEMASTVGLIRSSSQDQYGLPNVYTFVNQNLEADTVPAVGAGIYVVENTDDGPSSINARGGDPAGRWPVQIPLSAADQATLVALGDAYVAANKRATQTFDVPTAPWPCASHYDVLTYCEPNFGGSVIVEAQEWSMSLDDGLIAWKWLAV